MPDDLSQDPAAAASRDDDRVPRIVWLIAAVFSAVELAVSGLYGFQQDELYFLVASHHLDFGYVDQPPLAVLLARTTDIFGTNPTAIGAATEGVEQRFGVFNSAVFADATTLTSTGAVNSFHDSYTSLGGAMTLLNMMLGEVAPGGTGSGLYGILILSIITVFVAGLMVGRTPEYLGKKLGGREIKFASLYLLTTPALVLVGTAVAMALPCERGDGKHGSRQLDS